MKIAIDLTSLYGRKHTGIELYSIDLYKALLTTGYEIIPIFHAKNEIDNNPKAYIINKCNRLYLENIALSIAVRKIKADITIFPALPPPIDIYYFNKSKIYKVVHDMVYFNYRNTIPFAGKYYYTPKLLLFMKKADGIITISNTTLKSLKKITQKPIYNCGENISSAYQNTQDINSSYLKKWGISPNKYIISVSTIEPRKNLKYLLKVIKPFLIKNNFKLVLVGKQRKSSDKNLTTLISEMGDTIIFTDYIDIKELMSLYRYAYAFALFSLYEGFGRTPYEAVACGCKRVFLSDIEIFHETFEENATFFPLDNITLCQKILNNAKFKEISPNFPIPFNILEEKLKSVFLDNINI